LASWVNLNARFGRLNNRHRTLNRVIHSGNSPFDRFNIRRLGNIVHWFTSIVTRVKKCIQNSKSRLGENSGPLHRFRRGIDGFTNLSCRVRSCFAWFSNVLGRCNGTIE
jgi:hypothetical protein